LVIILLTSVANLMLHALSQPLQIACNEGASVTAADALRVAMFLKPHAADPRRSAPHGLAFV
jgi:hypothetical protein